MTVRKGGLALALVLVATAAVAALFTGRVAPDSANAASHREAPLISLDPSADISDFFAFRSYEKGKADRVVFILNVNPNSEPSAGPNYYGFDPSVTYSIGIDNNRDGKADDVRFDFRFKSEIRGFTKDLALPLRYIGGAGGLPPVTGIDDPGNGVRQTYEVTMTSGGQRHPVKLHDGSLPVLPANVGPRTTPNYESNFLSQGIKELPGGIRVFAGPRDDPFYIFLGGAFDTLNLNPFVVGSGVDQLSGFNVDTIALEVPMYMISGGSTAIGSYGFTSRPRITVRGLEKASAFDSSESERAAADLGRKLGGGGLLDLFGNVQIQRLANPLVNELVIGLPDKDRWNATKPNDDAQFLSYYLKPRFALAEQLVFGVPTGCLLPASVVPTCAPNPPANAGLDLAAFNRTDLQALLLQYNSIVYGAGAGGVNSDLLRLNLTTPPTPLDKQSSVPGALGGDPAAWPNGRRPKDDVTDIAAKAVGGPNYLPLLTIDGVEGNDKPYPAAFPFLAEPWDGVNRVHLNR